MEEYRETPQPGSSYLRGFSDALIYVAAMIKDEDPHDFCETLWSAVNEHLIHQLFEWLMPCDGIMPFKKEVAVTATPEASQPEPPDPQAEK